MKKKLLTLLLVLIIAFIGGCRTTSETSKNPNTSQTLVYEVFGMDCPGCHGGLEKNIGKVPGVTAVSANWEQKKVTIQMQEGQEIDSKAIETAIQKSNFTVGKRLE